MILIQNNVENITCNNLQQKVNAIFVFIFKKQLQKKTPCVIEINIGLSYVRQQIFDPVLTEYRTISQ